MSMITVYFCFGMLMLASLLMLGTIYYNGRGRWNNPPIAKVIKPRRKKWLGKARHLCSSHALNARLRPGQMVVLDEKGCEICANPKR